MTEKPCIRIGHLKIVDHLILGVADLQLKNHEFVLNHCVIDPLVMNSWEQLSEGLCSQDISGAFITAPLGMDLFESGLDIRLLMLTHRSGSMIVKKKGSGIQSISDFKGKTVLVPSELSIQNMLLHRLFSSASLKFGPHDDTGADVVREVVNPFLMPEMFSQDTDNDIAGYAVADPYGTQAILDGTAQKVCASNDLWKNHPCCTFVVNASVIENHPKAMEEIISLFVSIADKIQNRNTKDVFSNIETFLSMDKKTVKKIFSETAIQFDPSLLIPDIEALKTIAQYMKDSMGILNNEINLKTFIDDSFILNSVAEKTSIEN